MECLLITLLALIALPNSIFSEPITKIYDYELSADMAEKTEFKYPVKRERKKIKIT